MINIDIAEIEKRMAAHFGEPKDIHTQKAAEIFGVSADKVTPDQRRYAKQINFMENYNARRIPNNPTGSRTARSYPRMRGSVD